MEKGMVIKLGPMIDVYPELVQEINRQTIEEKKEESGNRPTRKFAKQIMLLTTN